MLQYRTNAGERRKPALGLYGELTVEQARSLAQNWLSEVRRGGDPGAAKRSEEHTSELQSLMRISYAVFCLKKKKKLVTQHKCNISISTTSQHCHKSTTISRYTACL